MAVKSESPVAIIQSYSAAQALNSLCISGTKALLCKGLHQIHHVVSLRQIRSVVARSLMSLQCASGPLMANFSLYCLFAALGAGGPFNLWKNKFIKTLLLWKQSGWLTLLYRGENKGLIYAWCQMNETSVGFIQTNFNLSLSLPAWLSYRLSPVPLFAPPSHSPPLYLSVCAYTKPFYFGRTTNCILPDRSWCFSVID